MLLFMKEIILRASLMSTLAERINEYLANHSSTNTRWPNAEEEQDSAMDVYEKDRDRISQQNEQESLKLLQTIFFK